RRARRRRGAGAASCWPSSAPTRRASTPTRRAPSPTSSWWHRSTARCCRSTRTATRRSSATRPASGRSRRTGSRTRSRSVMGSGPFKFKAYTRGATFEGVRNPDYFVKERPYLDGYKFFVSPETSVRAAAIRSGRAYIEFRDLPNAEVEAIKKQLGDKIVVQTTPMTGQFGIAINSTAKPFTDVRVRKALTLGLDRYTGRKVLYQLTSLRDVGAHM